MRQTFLFFMAVLLLMACATTKQQADQREQKARQVAEAIQRRHLRVDVSSMNTLRYGSHNITSDFYLELRGDTLVSYLPFFGQAYHSAAYGSPTQGLNFTSAVEELTETHHKRGMTRLEFLVRSDEDRYQYRLEIFPNGQTYIHVHGLSRDPVSFYGMCE